MLISMHYLRDCVVRLNSVRKLLDKAKDDEENGIDLDTVKSNFFGITLDMLTALSECEFSLTKPYMFTGSLATLKLMIKSVQATQDKKIFIEAIDAIIAPFQEFDYESFDAYAYKENFRYAHSYNEAGVDSEVIREVARSIHLDNDRVVNVIDPRCIQGVNAENFKSNFHNARLWGMGLSSKRIDETKKKFHRYVMGSLKGSNVSNDAFDVLILQPEISLDRVGERILLKKEKELIHKSINYLRPGGVMVLALPYFRFYKDICLLLSKNFANLQIRKYQSEAFSKSGFVYVTGVRKTIKEVDEDAYEILRYAFNIENIPDITEEPLEQITLPQNDLEIKLFRGSILDPDEIKRIYETSPCVSQFWNAQKVEKLSEHAKNPLLPFNEGQLGLVLCSGCLDGVVDEGNGHFHVVKGRVVKKIDNDSDIDMENNQIEVVETTSNRVEINVFLPDGTHKILA